MLAAAWSLVAVAGVIAGLRFGIALKRHNTKNAYFNDCDRWEKVTTSAIESFVRRHTGASEVDFVGDIFHCPPLIPGVSEAYHALCWAHMSDAECREVHSRPVLGADNAVHVIRDQLVFLGLADTPEQAEKLVEQVWLTNCDPELGDPDEAVRAATVSEGDYQRFRLAVLPLEDTCCVRNCVRTVRCAAASGLRLSARHSSPCNRGHATTISSGDRDVRQRASHSSTHVGCAPRCTGRALKMSSKPVPALVVGLSPPLSHSLSLNGRYARTPSRRAELRCAAAALTWQSPPRRHAAADTNGCPASTPAPASSRGSRASWHRSTSSAALLGGSHVLRQLDSHHGRVASAQLAKRRQSRISGMLRQERQMPFPIALTPFVDTHKRSRDLRRQTLQARKVTRRRRSAIKRTQLRATPSWMANCAFGSGL